MASMDPTTVDTIDADDVNEMSGESDAADREGASDDSPPRDGGGIAGESDRPGE